jgi:hypothetical protein
MGRQLMKSLALILSFCFVISYFSKAEEPHVSSRLDTNAGLIGDQIVLTLETKANEETNIVFPSIKDSLGGLEILDISDIDTVRSADGRTLKRKLNLTSFDSGEFKIPELTFMYDRKGIDELYPLKTSPLSVKFHTMEVDTSQAIKDIKGPLDEPLTFWDYWYYLLFALGAIIIIGLVIWLLTRKKNVKQEEEEDPKIPAHIFALEALKQLEKEKVWQSGEVKLYYVRLTEILRKYIERRFFIDALEMTTGEIVEAMEKRKMREEYIESVKNTLTLADLAKFAKHKPLPDEHANAMAKSVEFVELTKIVVRNAREDK